MKEVHPSAIHRERFYVKEINVIAKTTDWFLARTSLGWRPSEMVITSVSGFGSQSVTMQLKVGGSSPPDVAFAAIVE